MKKIEALRREANLNASAFAVQIDEAKEQLKPAKILDEMVGALDPGFGLLKHMQGRAREHPLAVLAVVSATMLLLRYLSTNARFLSPINHTDAKRSRLARSTAKGDNHGQHINAE
jgi:hypothetical protein